MSDIDKLNWQINDGWWYFWNQNICLLFLAIFSSLYFPRFPQGSSKKTKLGGTIIFYFFLNWRNLWREYLFVVCEILLFSEVANALWSSKTNQTIFNDGIGYVTHVIVYLPNLYPFHNSTYDLFSFHEKYDFIVLLTKSWGLEKNIELWCLLSYFFQSSTHDPQLLFLPFFDTSRPILPDVGEKTFKIIQPLTFWISNWIRSILIKSFSTTPWKTNVFVLICRSAVMCLFYDN